MNSLLRLKHWQLFLIFFIVSILSNFTLENNVQVTQLIRSVGFILFISIYFFYGISLVKHLPPRVELMDTVFTLNTFVIVISSLVIKVFFNGYFSGHGILGFVWVMYFFYAFFQFFSFPAKVLKSIELGREATFGEYFGYFMGFLFFPAGIWFLQPKMNRIVASNTNSQSSYFNQVERKG